MRRMLRWAGESILILGVLLVLAVATIYAAGQAGIGKDRLRMEAEKAIQSFAGIDVDTRLGGAGLTLHGGRFLGLEARDVRIARADTGALILDAGRMRFGLKFLPLLSGHVELSGVSIDDARFVPSRIHKTGGAEWDPDIRNDRGLIDPALVSNLVFRELHRTFDFVDAAGTRKVDLSNVSLVLPDRDTTRVLAVSELTIGRAATGRIAFSGAARFLAHDIAFSGSASRSPDKSMIASLEAALTVSASQAGNAKPGVDGAVPSASENDPQTSFGSFSLAVSGKETKDSGRLGLDVHLADAKLDLGEQGSMSGSADISASIRGSSDTVSIRHARVSAGRSKFDFAGAFRPLRASPADASPAYGFELASNNSTVAPTDSPEPALQIKARVAGRYVPATHEVTADTVEVRTPAGRMIASASMRFEPGETPGMTIALSASGLPTSHIKQLWPWFAAYGPRQWVLQHVFGGQVAQASIRLSVPPGRLGNGEPLSADEVSGHFRIDDTRFDIAGKMPPVRDGDGTLDFAGTDVKIGLIEGSVFMPGGLSVSTDGGTFTIHDANVFPRIGKLEIDVAGDASSMMKLASYDPINATRFFELTPKDLSGDVTGHISADIPLDGDGSTAELDWKASFAYQGLSLAKPVSGQTVTDADGTLEIGPDKADIKAEARLNGVPANIDMVEPLGGSDVERNRDIALTLDDETREKLMPGLDTILSGPATVRVDALGDGRQKVSMDLKQAVLTLPWIGWSKGKGIPASASFVMDAEDGNTSISDFSLSGSSFGARGGIELSGGKVASARFTEARLNRGDDFAVSIKRSDNGYAVSIDGDSIDARPLIKRFSGKAGTREDAASDTAIKLDARLASVSGFNDESLHGVDISYAGKGSAVSDLKISASTQSGGAVTASESRNSLKMKASEAGAVLRFLDIYPHMRGGRLTLALSGGEEGALSGNVEVRDFSIVNEPRLGSLVAAAPSGSSGAIDQSKGRQINASSVEFDRGYANISKGNGYLQLKQGVLRGPSIGTTFQGTVYDPQGNIDMTGTFMPVYGINRIFGELPLVGQILGNGRDRGLIGVTYKLTGKTSKPQLQINPISAIAPGILRQIFEFH